MENEENGIIFDEPKEPKKDFNKTFFPQYNQLYVSGKPSDEKKIPRCEELVDRYQRTTRSFALTTDELQKLCHSMVKAVHTKLVSMAEEVGKRTGEYKMLIRIDECPPLYGIHSAHPDSIKALLKMLEQLGYRVTKVDDCVEFTFDL